MVITILLPHEIKQSKLWRLLEWIEHVRLLFISKTFERNILDFFKYD